MIIDFGTKSVESATIAAFEISSDMPIVLPVKILNSDKGILAEFSSGEDCKSAYEMIQSAFKPIKLPVLTHVS